MREELRNELRRIEESYVREITPAARRRARQLIRILCECKCRQCAKIYDMNKSRADLSGYCSAKCQHAKAKSLGFIKSIHKYEYKILNNAGEIGSVFVCQ